MNPNVDRKGRLAADRGVLKPQKLAHIVRRTGRFDELVRWYCTVLGAEVVHSDGTLAFLTYDDEHHRIAIAGIPGLEEQPTMASGTDHVAFTYGDLGDLLQTYRRLKAAGIEPYWCVNHGPTVSLYYKDPDGSRIELQVGYDAVEGRHRRLDAKRRLRRQSDRHRVRSGGDGGTLRVGRAARDPDDAPAAPGRHGTVRHAALLSRIPRFRLRNS